MDDRSEAICWIIKNQFGRRNLTAFQRSELALKLKPQFEKEAKERMITSTGGANPKALQGSRKSDKPERTDEALGELAGVGKDTIRNTETILTQGSEKDIQEVRDGEVSISKKAKEIKERSKPQKATPPEVEREKGG